MTTKIQDLFKIVRTMSKSVTIHVVLSFRRLFLDVSFSYKIIFFVFSPSCVRFVFFFSFIKIILFCAHFIALRVKKKTHQEG